MGELLDIFLEEVGEGIRQIANFLGVKEVKEQHNNPSTLNSRIAPIPTPILKPKVTVNERRNDIDWQGKYISIFDRDHPFPQIKTEQELAYLESINKPRMWGYV